MIRAADMLPIPVPSEVSAFAAEQGVSAELPAVLEMTQRVFPGAAVSVQVEEDAEVADWRCIVLVVKAPHLSVEEAVEARWEWHRGLFACCPAPLVSVFCLGLEIGDKHT